MKFCSRCGTNLKEGQTFCPKCGHDLIAIKDKKNEESIEENIHNTKDIDICDSIRKKLVLSKKAKVSIIGIASAAILLTVFFRVGSSLTKPSKVVSKFQKAIIVDDKKELVDVLCSEDSRLKIDEKSIVPLVTYFKDEPSYLNTLLERLSKEAIEIEAFNEFNKFKQDESQSILNITYVGKKLLFFPEYKISVKPAFIEVNTGIKDVELLLNNVQIGKSDRDNFSKEFGPFIPGKYKLSSKYKGKYVSLSEPYDINLIEAENGKGKIDVFKNLNYTSIESEYPEAQLFVNTRDTGVKIKDAQNFGPLSDNSKVYAIIKKNGKTLRSNEYTVSQGDTNIYLSFEEAENQIANTENQLKELMYWYTYYFTQAVNTNDFSMIESYLYPGSKFYNEQQKYIPSTYNKGIRETIMSFEVLSCNLSEDNKSGSITTKEVYNIDSNGQASVKTFKYEYKFRYNEVTGSYQIESISDNLI